MNKLVDLPAWRPSIAKNGEKCACNTVLDESNVVARGVYTGRVLGCFKCIEEIEE